MNVSADELRELISNHPLSGGLEPGQIDEVLALIKEERLVAFGEYLVREGEIATEIYFVNYGRFEILKEGDEPAQAVRVAVKRSGESIGEISLLDSGARSASVRALEDCSVFVMSVRDLELTGVTGQRIKLNLAHHMGLRVRLMTEATIEAMRDLLALAEMRAEMGRFMTAILVSLALYMFALEFASALSRVVPSTELISVPIIGLFALGVFHIIKKSPYPLSRYGLTRRDWRRHALEAAALSLPAAGLIIAFKAIWLEFSPDQDRALFDLSRNTGLTLLQIVLFSLAYAVFTPVQEFIVRSGIQCSCEMFLTGKRNSHQLAILLSNLLFSATHLHVSMQLALFVFPFGLFWGWLFHRQGSLVGSSLSHCLLGVFGFFVVGFPSM